MVIAASLWSCRLARLHGLQGSVFSGSNSILAYDFTLEDQRPGQALEMCFKESTAASENKTKQTNKKKQPKTEWNTHVARC